MRINKIYLLFALLIFGHWPYSDAYAVKFEGRAKDVSTGKSFYGKSCFFLHNLSINTNGLVVLNFRANEYYIIYECKAEIYDIQVNPVGTLMGLKNLKEGVVKGNFYKSAFSIILSTKAEAISLQMLDKDGKAIKVKYPLSKSIGEAIRSHAVRKKLGKWDKIISRNASPKGGGSLKPSVVEKIPPKISIKSPQLSGKIHRTDTYQTYVRGRATDNKGVLTILVNGKKAGVKADGTFAAKLKLAFGANKIKVQAEDINGNIAEKNFTIIREEYIPEETLADVDIPKKTKMNNPDGIAVVIGVESYQYVADATYAYNDAEVFREYLADTLGYKKSRIKIATNSKATQAEFSKLLGSNGWIARNVKAKKSDVVVYFSGHGIPDAKTKKTGLLPFDVDPNYSVGLALKDLYKSLGSLNARSVTVFLDTCFSGQGREKQTLLADARGIQIVPKERGVPSNITVLSAATAGQISGPIKDKEHGLFTYYLLKGLGGAADGDKDKKLTIAELAKYVHSKVKEDAALKGREQTPELQGGGKRVLVRW